jgi:hypothetical protein
LESNVVALRHREEIAAAEAKRGRTDPTVVLSVTSVERARVMDMILGNA